MATAEDEAYRKLRDADAAIAQGNTREVRPNVR